MQFHIGNWKMLQKESLTDSDKVIVNKFFNLLTVLHKMLHKSVSLLPVPLHRHLCQTIKGYSDLF